MHTTSTRVMLLTSINPYYFTLLYILLNYKGENYFISLNN